MTESEGWNLVEPSKVSSVPDTKGRDVILTHGSQHREQPIRDSSDLSLDLGLSSLRIVKHGVGWSKICCWRGWCLRAMSGCTVGGRGCWWETRKEGEEGWGRNDEVEVLVVDLEGEAAKEIQESARDSS